MHSNIYFKFHETSTISKHLIENLVYIFSRNPSIRAEFLQNDRQTDRRDEADSQFR